MKTYIIQLESHDDMISTRDKMAWSKAARILLVWPRKGVVLERPVDLLVLQRHAQSLGAQLGVVTANAEIRENARELGIPQFHSAVQAQKQSWRRPRGFRKVNWRKYRRKVDITSLRSRLVEFRQASVEPTWRRVLAFSLGILAFVTLVLFFLPSAQIEISPAQKNEALTIDLWANPNIQTAQPSGGIPAYPVSVIVEGSDQAASSGKMAIANHQATGEVLFSNITDAKVHLPAGTVVLSGDGIRFETTRDVDVAAGTDKTSTVGIQAVLPGSAGNVGAGSIHAIEGAAGLQVLVNNPAATQGGSDRYSPAPQASDYQAVKSKLLDALHKTAQEELKLKLAAGQRLLVGTLTNSGVKSEVQEPVVGNPGDYARLTMQVEFTAWTVNEDDLQAVARTSLEANRDEGFSPLPEPVKIDFVNEPTIGADGSARWKANVQRVLEAKWSKEGVVHAVIGRSPVDAKRVLAENIVMSGPAQIRLSPSWWMRMPFLSFQVEVVKK